jgi:predicted O-methyltransferase YrrM
MTELLNDLLRELERFGEANDAQNSERPRRMNNITRDTGEFLSVLVLATRARRVLEIGTSNGYSTLWLASAARAIGGAVTTVELADYKVGLARENFGRSELEPSITLVQDDAGRVLERTADASQDLIFLDSDRSRYADWWPAINRVLRPSGLLVVDNATSHPDEVAPLVGLITADADYRTSRVPVGKGEILAVKAG